MHQAKSIIPERQANVDISSNQSVFSFKDVVDKPTAAISPAVNILPIQPIVPIKPTSHSEEPKHEILKSNISIQEDIITNPQDYETQTFGFDLKCRYNHFWRAGKALPVSNGKAFCRKCGEPLRKAAPTKRQQTQGQGYHFN